GGAELGDRFVGPGFQDFHTAGDDVAWAGGGLEVPVHVQENGARAGQGSGGYGVEDGAGDPALDDDLAEARGLRGRGVVVQGVAVPADLGEPLDVVWGDGPGQLGGLADRGWTARPAGIHGVVLPVMVMAGSLGLILR